MIGLITVLIVIDQLTKAYVVKNIGNITIIPNFLDITYVQNSGAIFGTLRDSNTIMAVISFLVCIIICVYLAKIYKKNKSIVMPLSFILAGGISNFVDRVFRGFVVDYIDTPFIATFNLADSFIVIGVILIVINEIKGNWKSENNSRRK